MQPVLINGTWTASQNPTGSFHAFNPSTKEKIAEREFPTSSWAELEAIVEAGYLAANALRDLPVSALAEFLEAYADKIEAKTQQLAEIGNLETGLPVAPRLAEVEIPRTVNQLRLAAAARRSGDWARPTIDTAANIRALHGPLGGPVVVFGPNNFPFAYNGISGGDFAAAIAAGNPVIAKAHPAHPYTSQLLAELAMEAVTDLDLPPATVQFFYNTEPELGLRLVSHSRVAAVAFTGSRSGGLALKAAADQAGKPIYLEMSSVNPVFVLPGALQERSAKISDELHGSCTLAAGQFCTKPGLLVLVESPDVKLFLDTLKTAFEETPPGCLLTAGGVETVTKAVKQLTGAGAKVLAGGKAASAKHYGYLPTLLKVEGDTFLQHPQRLQSEAFGPVCLAVIAKSVEQATTIASKLEGNLTGSIYSHSKGKDDESYDVLENALRLKVGRLLNDKVPTGVAVSAAMNHGGPYPATGHPGFTAVGFPAGVIRFSALHSYDNVRHERLPTALQDKNPTGSLLRLVDGNWTTDDVKR